MKSASVEIGEAHKGQTAPRTHPAGKKQLITRPREDVGTLWEMISYSCNRRPDKDAMGSRRLIKIHEEEKMVNKMVDGQQQKVPKKWTYFEMGPYEYITYGQLLDEIKTYGSALKKLGMQPKDKLHLYAATSANWQIMAHAASSQSMSIVTAYDTLGEEGLTHSLTETSAKGIFLDAHLLTSLINPLKKAKAAKFIIYNDFNEEVNKVDIEALSKAHPELKIMSMGELKDLGKKNPAEPVPPSPEDLACVMYTSGSTGPPKGVIIKHRNIIAAVAGLNEVIAPFVFDTDFLIAYLPLAHVLEFVFESVALYRGTTLGYGTVRTISDTNMKNCKGDIREFRPTIMVGVPAVWETVRKGVLSKLGNAGMIKQNLFWGAYHAKLFMKQTGIPGTGVIDNIFKAVKDATGGRLRFTLSGGAPVSKETQEFLTTVICPMIIGYGLTETCASCAIMPPAQWTTNSTGAPLPSLTMKLVDVPDAGYFSTNNPPQGEIWLNGPAVTSGYLNRDKETKESFTDDGWFMSGDIGQWMPNGHIAIIDRKKNLVKTLNGEYIALEKLESTYRACNVVSNICVYADQNQVKPIAIIVPAEPALKKLASSKGVSGDLEELIHDDKIKAAVRDELIATARKGGLGGIELVQAVVLTDEEWTPQNNLVTSAQKLNRKAILDKYKKEVDQAYKTTS